MVEKKLIEKYISAYWGSFIEQTTKEIDHSLQIYTKNKDTDRNNAKKRKLIAPAENFSSCLAVMYSAIALESFFNAQAFYKGFKDFDTWQSLSQKAKKFGVTSRIQLDAIEELSVCRDSIIHSHLWLKYRSSDKDTYSLKEVRSYLWSPFKSKLRQKFLLSTDWKLRSTKHIGLNIIPLDISYLDATKAFKVLVVIMEKIFTDEKTSWRQPIYPLQQEGYSPATTQSLNHFNHPADWLKFFEKNLNEIDRQIYSKIFFKFDQECKILL